MGTTVVNRKTLIGEIVNQYPETAEVLLGIGMHCLAVQLPRRRVLRMPAPFMGLILKAS